MTKELAQCIDNKDPLKQNRIRYSRWIYLFNGYEFIDVPKVGNTIYIINKF